MASSPSRAPAFDLPNLAVHSLWWAWLPGLLLSWSLLPVAGRVGMLVLGLGVLFWNYAVLHNHMHVPVARPRALRWLVSRTLGLSCGFPYRAYYLHHFNHHKYNDGPGDWGRRHPGEGVPHYLLRSTLMQWFWPFGALSKVWQSAKTRGQRAEVVLDVIVVDGALLLLLFWQPALGLSYWGMLILGQMSIYWLNLAAHFETDASRRDALGVTSTSRLYNLFFFNAGYHQAHHLRPQVPWRDLPTATRELAAAARLRPTLQTPVAPINPLWVARLVRSYSAKPCDRQTESTITSRTPSAVT